MMARFESLCPITRTASFINKHGDRVLIKCFGEECYMNDTAMEPRHKPQEAYRPYVLSRYFRISQLDSTVYELTKRGYKYAFSTGFNSGNFLGEFVREFDYLETSLYEQ